MAGLRGSDTEFQNLDPDIKYHMGAVVDFLRCLLCFPICSTAALRHGRLGYVLKNRGKPCRAVVCVLVKLKIAFRMKVRLG